MLKKFNYGANINKKLKDNITFQLEYKWKNFKNNCIQSKEDVRILEKLPREV